MCNEREREREREREIERKSVCVRTLIFYNTDHYAMVTQPVVMGCNQLNF